MAKTMNCATFWVQRNQNWVNVMCTGTHLCKTRAPLHYLSRKLQLRFTIHQQISSIKPWLTKPRKILSKLWHKFFLTWSAISQSVCQRAFSLLTIWCLRPCVRILHSVEEDNLSPFDSKITCLCQSIDINNNRHTFLHTYIHTCLQTYIHTYIHTCMHTYIHTYLLLLISMLWHRHAIFKSKGDKLCSSAESRFEPGIPDTKSPADWMLADKPTELSRIKLKTWTPQPVPMISEHSAHLTPLSVDFRTWLWRYIYLLLLISMLWHRQALFKSKGDKLCSSAESRIWTLDPRHQIASRLNARWKTDWAIEDQAKKLNSTARSYDQRAFSPLDPTVSWLSHLALAIYIFVVVNFDALAQASHIQIERR